LCEKATFVRANGNPSWLRDGDWYLIQYEDAPDEQKNRDSCLRYLADCGHEITTEPHEVVGPGDEPAMSWGDLSDLVMYFIESKMPEPLEKALDAGLTEIVEKEGYQEMADGFRQAMQIVHKFFDGV